jgi:hypothetical protein
MDKKTHDIIQKYNQMVATLYFELDELGIGSEKLGELLNKFDAFYDETYKVCLHEDKEKAINKEAMLIKSYEEWSRYLRLNVIYEYDNGYVKLQSETSV